MLEADLAETLQHLHLDPMALLQAREEAADRVILPAGGLADLRDSGALLAAKQGKHRLLFRALPRLGRSAGLARGARRLAGQGGPEGAHRAVEGGDHVRLAVRLVVPGGQHRRSGVAQVGVRGGRGRGLACLRGRMPLRGVLPARGRRVRHRRGSLGGGAALGIVARDGLGAPLVLRPRVARVRVDADGASPSSVILRSISSPSTIHFACAS